MHFLLRFRGRQRIALAAPTPGGYRGLGLFGRRGLGLALRLSASFAIGLVEAQGQVGKLQVTVICACKWIVRDGFGDVIAMFSEKIFVDPEAKWMVLAGFGDAAL